MISSGFLETCIWKQNQKKAANVHLAHITYNYFPKNTDTEYDSSLGKNRLADAGDRQPITDNFTCNISFLLDDNMWSKALSRRVATTDNLSHGRFKRVVSTCWFTPTELTGN